MPVSAPERPAVAPSVTRPLPSHNRPFQFPRRVLKRLTTHIPVLLGVGRLRDWSRGLFHRYNVSRNHWRHKMGSSGVAATHALPVLRTPGVELTKDELRQAQEYFEHQDGVVIKGTDWTDDDLGDADEPLSETPAVR